MKKDKRKKFDWYSMKQRFALRKYHFGLASVFLGAILSTGIDTVQAEEPEQPESSLGIVTSDVTVSENKLGAEEISDTVFVNAEEHNLIVSQRRASIKYEVVYIEEQTGEIVANTVHLFPIDTYDEIAKATIYETVNQLPKGYDLADGQLKTVSKEIIEKQDNVIEIKVKKIGDSDVNRGIRSSSEASSETATSHLVPGELKKDVANNTSLQGFTGKTIEKEVITPTVSPETAPEITGKLVDKEVDALVTPNMDDENGARITPSEYPADRLVGFNPDPTPGYQTIGIIDLIPFKPDGPYKSSFNEDGQFGNYYITLSTLRTASENRDVVIRVVDKDTQKEYSRLVLTKEEVPVTSNNGDNVKQFRLQLPSITTKQGNAQFWMEASYATVESDFAISRDLVVFRSYALSPATYVAGKYELLASDKFAVRNAHRQDFEVPRLVTNVVQYKEEGTNKLLAKYEITGKEGDLFEGSHKREIEGYEYVSGEPQDGAIRRPFTVGGQRIYRDNDPKGPNSRVHTIINEQGDVVIQILAWTILKDGVPTFVSQIEHPEGEWRVLFTSEVLSPGQESKIGNKEQGTSFQIATAPADPNVKVKRVIFSLLNPLTPGMKETVYYYRKQGTVSVNYYDKQGNPIKDPQIVSQKEPIATSYDTTTDTYKPNTIVFNGATYRFVEHKSDSDAPTGVTEANKDKLVTYIYEIVKGDVIVKYVDLNGTEIKESVKDMDQASTGTDYNTHEDNRPLTVEKNGKIYELVPAGNYAVGNVDQNGRLTTSGAEIGKVVEGTTEVTYVYKEKSKGDVVIKYVTIDGTEIKEPQEDTPSSYVGTPYDTTDNKPTVIEKDGKRYFFAKVKEGDHETGTVVEGTTHVTYIYREYGSYLPYIPGVDTPGDRPPVPYDDTPLEPEDNPPLPYIPGYTPKDPAGNPLKPVDPTDPSKGYVPPTITNPNDPGTDTPVPYEKDPAPEVKKGTVVVRYVNEKGESIASDRVDTPESDVNTPYDTTDNKPTVIEKDGKRYFFAKVKEGDHETGTVVEGPTHVTYIYREYGSYLPYIPGVDNPGDRPPVPYDDTPLEPEDNPPLPYIPGYTPKDPAGNPLTPVDPTDPTKGYVPPSITNPNDPGTDTPVPYEKDPAPEVKKGTVVVRYVNEKGESIASDRVDTPESDVNTPYDTTDNKPTVIEKDGKRYFFAKVKEGDHETGTVVEGPTHVTYIYREYGSYLPYIPGVDNPGDRPPVPYDDTPLEPEDNPPLPYIPGYTPKDPAGNPLTPVDPTDPSKGYVPPTITNPNDPGVDTPVPYEKDPAPKGTVVVRYVNEKGESIASDRVDTPESDVNTPYDTTDNKPTVIEKDGKRYFFAKVKEGDHETGTVVEGPTHVTYIYREYGSYLPYIPGVDNPGDRPPVPYDDTPLEPEDNPPLPYIPGYTPKDPAGNPLKPADPTDPSKGYVPPSITNPNDPGTDTPVPYEKDPAPKGTVVVRYVNEKGESIASDRVDTPESDVNTPYDTTDNKPVTIEKDGKRYFFAKVKEGDHETGTVVEGTTHVTYIYREYGSYLPYIPGVDNPGNRPPVPYDDTPLEPEDNPPLPYIPGYTPKDPAGNPLKPVDPTDPTKGYVPPTITNPNDPGVDTPVPYEKNPAPQPAPGPKKPDSHVSGIPGVDKRSVRPTGSSKSLPATGEKTQSVEALTLGLGMLLGATGLRLKRKREE
ncbi:MucBP domain-containing protein [Streptococcus sp. VEG1o]|uniref:MucBP domain-containing protein n=1 Tax=unclassified Streptococcus TaxID=2608887 RepID=UPI00397D66E6